MAFVALVLVPAVTPADTDTVTLDLSSGTVVGHLPFDVPFALVGDAPPGTTRVSMQYRLGTGGGNALEGEPRPEEAMASGVDAAGRFRLPVPALPPGREVRFEIAVDRALTEAGRRAFRDAALPLLASVGARTGLDPSSATALDVALRDALTRSIAEGRRGVVLPGAVQVTAAAPLFDSAATPAARETEVRRLARDVLAARDELASASERHAATVPSLQAALSTLASNPDLDALTRDLERSPELDPRSPRSVLALPADAREIVSAEAARVATIAAGGETAGWAAGADAGFARDRHRRTAVALGQLRTWLEEVLAPGRGRAALDALVASGGLEVEAVPRLQALAAPSGAIARAQAWAESLEAAAADAGRARVAEERALATLADVVEEQAAAAVVRQEVSARASTGGGLYVSLDAGVLYAFEADSGSLYLGASVSFGPVNKDAPLPWRGSLRRRLSAIVGITFNDLTREDDTSFENLVGSRWNVVAGLGLRVTRSLRVGAGVLLLLKNDSNPLVTDRSLGAVPYVSLSLDLDVGRLAGGGGR